MISQNFLTTFIIYSYFSFEHGPVAQSGRAPALHTRGQVWWTFSFGQQSRRSRVQKQITFCLEVPTGPLIFYHSTLQVSTFSLIYSYLTSSLILGTLSGIALWWV